MSSGFARLRAGRCVPYKNAISAGCRIVWPWLRRDLGVEGDDLALQGPAMPRAGASTWPVTATSARVLA
ncbi:hypothetical protein I547_5925 [Mycobacterium kansasii 824]|uniref:Uncharacterized protein n=1 Tax=Mycobacterium kansasii TaxID=1768 RepID=A0A1V3X7J6_MYCKA|nr:hypothetical protein I547_5925 [Mycobacterium kansasii 824]OOK70506.1 hypothetical protein BZL30_6136 [Mycobacterium kansasii]OOK74766.1 hypothetical protein BZL29_4185 [Mycobacterium kansasii]